MNESNELGRLSGCIEGIQASLVKIEKVLMVGNGVPSMVDRMARVEENLERIAILFTETATKSNEDLAQLHKSIEELTDVVSAHVKDEKKHEPISMMMRKDVILYGILIFMVLHTVIPENINLWTVLSKFFGV